MHCEIIIITPGGPLIIKGGYDARSKKEQVRGVFILVSNVRDVLAQSVKNSNNQEQLHTFDHHEWKCSLRVG